MTAMDARVVSFDANKLRALIAKYLGIDAEQATDEAHFRNDFDFDSLDQLELLILIEKEFSVVEFSNAAVEQIEITSHCETRAAGSGGPSYFGSPAGGSSVRAISLQVSGLAPLQTATSPKETGS